MARFLKLFFCCRNPEADVSYTPTNNEEKPILVYEQPNDTTNQGNTSERLGWDDKDGATVSEPPSSLIAEPHPEKPASPSKAKVSWWDNRCGANSQQHSPDTSTDGSEEKIVITQADVHHDGELNGSGGLRNNQRIEDSKAKLNENILEYVDETTRSLIEEIDSELERLKKLEISQIESKESLQPCNEVVPGQNGLLLSNGHNKRNDCQNIICDVYNGILGDDLVLYNGFYLPCKLDNLPTLVLDLDNTLIYSSYSEDGSSSFKDVKFEQDGLVFTVKVKERPFLSDFLASLSKHYEIVVFSAGVASYCQAVVKEIDRNGFIKHVLDRRHCSNLDSEDTPVLYTKNIGLLGRDLSRTIIVDDLENSYIHHYTNGQIIPQYLGDDSDDCLVQLKDYLLSCLEYDDFRLRRCLKYKYGG